MYHIFLINPSVDAHLGWFHVLAIVNSAPPNIGLHVSFWIRVVSRYMFRSGISGSYIYIFGLFSIVAAIAYISTNSVAVSLSSSPSTAFVICRVFHDGTKIFPWGSTINMFEEHKLPWEILASSLSSAFHSLFLASPVIDNMPVSNITVRIVSYAL